MSTSSPMRSPLHCTGTPCRLIAITAAWRRPRKAAARIDLPAWTGRREALERAAQAQAQPPASPLVPLLHRMAAPSPTTSAPFFRVASTSSGGRAPGDWSPLRLGREPVRGTAGGQGPVPHVGSLAAKQQVRAKGRPTADGRQALQRLRTGDRADAKCGAEARHLAIAHCLHCVAVGHQPQLLQVLGAVGDTCGGRGEDGGDEGAWRGGGAVDQAPAARQRHACPSARQRRAPQQQLPAGPWATHQTGRGCRQRPA